MSSSVPGHPPSLEKWMKDHDLPATATKEIRILGVNRVGDLIDLDEEDIATLPFKKIEGKRFRRGIADLKQNGVTTSEDTASTSMLTDANYAEGSVFDVWGSFAWASFRNDVDGDKPLSLQEKLNNFYARHNPTKIGEVADIMETYKDNEKLLWEHMFTKYCLHSKDGQVFYKNVTKEQRENALALSGVVPGVLVGSNQGEEDVRTVRKGMLVLPLSKLSLEHKTLLGIDKGFRILGSKDDGTGMGQNVEGTALKTTSGENYTVNIPFVLREFMEAGSLLYMTNAVKELTYEFTIGTAFHQIKVSHAMKGGLKTIQVDGTTVVDTISGLFYEPDGGDQHHFKCAGLDFVFTIRLHGTYFALQSQTYTYEILAAGFGVKEHFPIGATAAGKKPEGSSPSSTAGSTTIAAADTAPAATTDGV